MVDMYPHVSIKDEWLSEDNQALFEFQTKHRRECVGNMALAYIDVQVRSTKMVTSYGED